MIKTNEFVRSSRRRESAPIAKPQKPAPTAEGGILPRLAGPAPCRALLVALLAGLLVHPALGATYVVSNTGDSGAGSLRQAILDANANPGPDTIIFAIGAGVQTITPLSVLPIISDPVVIDGTTQPGFIGRPLIEINGVNVPGNAGLRLLAGKSTVRSLAINRFGGQGILVQGPGTNLLSGNFIGTDPTGTSARGNGLQGIWIDGSFANTISGTNLISGNGDAGIFIDNSAGNVVQGNLIGTTISGTTALGNGNNGVTLYSASGSTVGGTTAAARNVISGNAGSGVYVLNSDASANIIRGNYLGADITGGLALTNHGDGLTIQDAPANTIGGTASGAGNIISGNAEGGVSISGATAVNNQIQGNLIGVAVSGTAALANGFSGVTILNANSNSVGGVTAAARNVISGNRSHGVYVTTNCTGTTVTGNYIGVDSTGANALGNSFNGVSVDNAFSTTVGGAVAGARNILSANGGNGIELYPSSAASLVQGNYVGTSASGGAALGNAYTGLRVESAFNVVNSGNLISGNVSNGVWLVGNTAANNLLQGNWIGVALGGSSGLSNGLAGIGITEAPNNTIGGSAAGQGNLISANGDAGIFLLGTGVTGTIIQGNTIGADITGNSSLANRFEGIYSEKASNGTIGGSGPGAGNQIAGNTTREVWLTNSSYNVVQGNLIGVKADGVSNLGQKFFGVEMEVGANGNTIGGSAGAGNRIAYSQTVYAGVRVRDEATNNAILGNAIWGNGPTGGLGIDLGNYGVNANVNCGALTLTAANMYQNYPVLSQAFGGGPTTQVRGSLNSHPNTTYLLQFFGNPTCDPSGYGQGQIYLGDKMLALGASCSSNFVATVAGVPASYVVTATATDPAGNTSEFSACQVITPIPILNITNSGNHQVSIAWTNTATGFSLYCATNLGTSPILPPSIWSLVTNVPVVLNGNYIVSFPTTNYGDKFFTLIHP